jgi:hypothetical protein
LAFANHPHFVHRTPRSKRSHRRQIIEEVE